MHLFKYTFLIGIFFFNAVSAAKLPKSYERTPVLLHLSSIKQNDSIGFNLVRALPELIYAKLLTGDLALWEGSDKTKVVGSQEFAALERTAVTPFVGGEDLFIHEYWQIFKKNFTFEIQGFSFTGRTKFGGKINYGYVDAKDILNLLKTYKIPANASGSSELTYWDALQSKSYQFNLVQFGYNDFRNNANASTFLQYQAIHDPKIQRELATITPIKEISYKVLSPSINSNIENKNFYSIFTEYVNDNKQTILNATDEAHFQTIFFENWKIDNISITEKWSKHQNIPFQELISIELFIDKHAVSLNTKQLEEMGIKVNLQQLPEYISEKRFSFLIEKINNQEIAPQQSEAYYKALSTKPWNKITP